MAATATDLTAAALRAYLRQRKSRNRVPVPEFEDFLRDMSTLLTLRMAAEENWGGSPRATAFETRFLEHKYLAFSVREALPLEWCDINPILLPDGNEPRRTLVTYVAARCIEDVRVISSGLRRVLNRERLSTPVGKVQQLDTHCMRWLMRQPGRTFAEKAGTRQRVMAVVRREQFDTLENRVFKDFLVRCENLAGNYLEEIRGQFRDHRVFKSVHDFKVACQGALDLPEMAEISGLTAMPHPNYVLQQDNNYSKIWESYCRVVQFANMSEKIWTNRGLLREKLANIRRECLWQMSHEASYHSQIWVNPVDGRPDFFESPTSNHTEAQQYQLAARAERRTRPPVSDGVGIVDISGSHVWGPALVRGGFHPNARPRIHCEWFPLWDDEDDALRCARVKHADRIVRTPLHFIFSGLNDQLLQDENGERFSGLCRDAGDYCERLFGEYRELDRSRPVEELVVLAPDDWNAVTQEVVIRSFPMLDRRRIHLLWRSIATVLGLESQIDELVSEGDSVAVVDFRNDGTALVTNLKYLLDDESGRLVPQRSVFLKNGRINASRYDFRRRDGYSGLLDSNPVRAAAVVCLVGCVPASFLEVLGGGRACEDMGCSGGVHFRRLRDSQRIRTILTEERGAWWQKDGAVLFSREHAARTLYFDELEPMWVVGQGNEKVVRTAIVEGNEKFRGGDTHEQGLPEGLLQIGAGQHGVEFLFHIGELHESTRLHSYKEPLPGLDVRNNVPLSGTIAVSPGQGIAVTTVSSRVFPEPIRLDYLHNMELSRWSIKLLEEEMPRSFPPTCAIVEAFPGDYYETSFFGGYYAPVKSLAKVRLLVRGYVDGKRPLKDIPDDAFAMAQRRSPNSLEPGESKLHLLDRRNVFGNYAPCTRPSWLSEEEEGVLIRKLLAALPRNQDKCLRLLAWMYRGGNPDLAKRVKAIVQDYSRCVGQPTGISAVEVSFLSNYLADRNLRLLEFDALKALFARLKNGFANGNDFRLFYNLMQFDADMFSKFSFSLSGASSIVRCLLRDMRTYRRKVKPMNYKSCLRVFLYFLRMREKERFFLRPKEMYVQQTEVPAEEWWEMAELFSAADNELGMRIEDESSDVRMLRLATKRFLNGRGTLEDIVTVAGGD